MLRYYFADSSVLTGKSIFSRCLQSLPISRREKIMKYKNENAACLSMAAGLLLKKAFSDLGLDSDNYEEVIDIYGRPSFLNCPVDYNLSHSGKIAMCCLCDFSKVGCDIEIIQNASYRIAGHFYAVEENSLLNSLSNETERNEMFYRIWTLRESYGKCIGRGLNIPRGEYHIDFLDNSPQLIDCKTNSSFKLYEIFSVPGYSASICIEGNNPEKPENKGFLNLSPEVFD